MIQGLKALTRSETGYCTNWLEDSSVKTLTLSLKALKDSLFYFYTLLTFVNMCREDIVDSDLLFIEDTSLIYSQLFHMYLNIDLIDLYL